MSGARSVVRTGCSRARARLSCRRLRCPGIRWLDTGAPGALKVTAESRIVLHPSLANASAAVQTCCVSAQIGVSAEDRFALLDMASEGALFPHPFVLGNVALAFTRLGRRWDPVWDFRRAGSGLYSDILDAYGEAASVEPDRGWKVVADPAHIEAVHAATYDARHNGAQYRPDDMPAVIPMRNRNLRASALKLDPFDDLSDSWYDYASLLSPTEEQEIYGINALELGFVSDIGLHEWEKAEAVEKDFDTSYIQLHEETQAERTRLLDEFLTGIASNSLLVELGIHVERDRVSVIPYHAHSVHNVEDVSDGLVLVRPARRHAGYVASFHRDLARLERLLNDPNVRERQIEEALLDNPLFLRGLNYQKVYAQVVLPRRGADDLRPDIIAEPIDSDWAEIIDLKLPSEPVLVGRPNRARLAAGITSVVRQLQEYAAYFEERTIAQRVEAKYGFKCYRPKLTAIVGRDPAGYSAEETKRAMTSFPDVEIVTFDGLVRAARRLPLF